MILPIYTQDNPILKEICQPVLEIDDNIASLIDDMHETMQNANGIGLAAPQIGRAIRLIVVEYQDEKYPAENFPFIALINPKITWRSNKLVSILEGCLSVPGLEGPVLRPEKVRVKATDKTGRNFEIKASGLLARVLQHEIDHLDGVVFTELVESEQMKKCDIRDYPMIHAS